MDKSPIYHGADRDKQAITLTFTTTDHLESLIHWTRLHLDGGGGWTTHSKPMQVLEKHADSTQERPGLNPEPFCCEATPPKPAYRMQRFIIWLWSHSSFEYLCTKLVQTGACKLSKYTLENEPSLLMTERNTACQINKYKTKWWLASAGSESLRFGTSNKKVHPCNK